MSAFAPCRPASTLRGWRTSRAIGSTGRVPSGCRRRHVDSSFSSSGYRSSRVNEGIVRASSSGEEDTPDVKLEEVNKDVSSFARKTAATFAPRSSSASKNPAVKGTVLYNVFILQSVVAAIVGGLAAYNVIWPTDEPSIPRLLGMWSIWIFVVPSLRARDCGAREKDALNIAFVGMPLLNILLPFVWKSFAFVFTADVLMMGGLYYWKLGTPSEGGEGGDAA